MGRLKEPTHCSQRVGDVVPGVVVWSLCVYSHGWVGKCSEILAALSYSVDPRVNKDMMTMMMMKNIVLTGGKQNSPHRLQTLRTLNLS